jgi:oligoendopeptidase F
LHLPSPAYYDGSAWQPARFNFCAHSIPNQKGMGEDGLTTLFHEGGHAAHFANISAGGVSYSMAPSAHGYTETQSMFLDRVLDDADWLTHYAHMPMELIERSLRTHQPFEATVARRVLPICYFERALYQLPDSELTTDNVIALARKIEKELWFLNGATKPILSATHPQDNPCMAHGYLLAQMAVHQSREYFFQKYGHIMDNPQIGPELSAAYWQHGNAKPFYTMVRDMTGKDFSADAFVAEVTTSVDDAIAKAQAQVARLTDIPQSTSSDLDAHVRVIHGKETIAEFSNGTFEAANQQFKSWVRVHYPKGE